MRIVSPNSAFQWNVLIPHFPYPLFPIPYSPPLCYNHRAVERAAKRESAQSPGRASTGRSSICWAFAVQPESRRSSGRSFAVLSHLLAAVGVAALQIDLFRMRLLHVLRGLLLAAW